MRSQIIKIETVNFSKKLLLKWRRIYGSTCIIKIMMMSRRLDDLASTVYVFRLAVSMILKKKKKKKKKKREREREREEQKNESWEKREIRKRARIQWGRARIREIEIWPYE